MAEEHRSSWRWTVVVPLLTLAVFGVGLVLARATRPPDRPLDVTPPPEAELPGIVLPPRTRALDGTVVAPDGSAVPDALVSTVVSDEPHWTYTDASGAFAFEGLERGPWTITVTATAHQPFTTTVADDSTPVVVRLSDAPRAHPTLGPRVVAPLDGIVSAPPDVRLAGLEILLVPRQAPEEIDAPMPRRVQCDSGGRFAIPDLQQGDYTVAVLPEWAQNGSWPDLSRGQGEAAHGYTHGVGAGSLALSIEAGAIRGLVADQEHQPLAGALVLVSLESSPESVWPPATADAEGRFTVADLPPDRYVVAVRAGSGAHTTTVTVQARETVDLDLPPLPVERPR